MLIKKSEISALSDNIRKVIDGQIIDFRDNKEGYLSILKNDIHTLVNMKNEKIASLEQEHEVFVEFMEDISHQLKTPVTSMMIMVDLLETATPEKQEEFIDNIKISLNRMEWMVGSLLKMAKLGAGAIGFEKKTIAASELLKATIEPLAILLDIKNQTVTIKNDVVLDCDKRWTVEALTNIIKNASEYSKAHTAICIDCGENPIYQWISVTDTGEGIKREAIGQIFKRFDGSRNGDGYGIGLPLALAIMRSQNGDIDVERGGNGKGATFTIKLFK